MKRQIGMVLVVLIGLSAALGCRPTTATIFMHNDGKCVPRDLDETCDITREAVPEGAGFCSARNARSACALQESSAGFDVTAYVTGATSVFWILSPSLALYELLPNVVIEWYNGETLIASQAAGTCSPVTTPPTLTRACLSVPENRFTYDVTYDFKAFTEDSAGRRNSSVANMRVVQKGKPEP